jgi:transcriptional regulator with XRE-family HTH domain
MHKEVTPVPEVRNPAARRRELGALLRALRQERGLTVEQVAVELLCSPSKVSRMETGRRGATLRDVRDLCRIYGATDQIQDRLLGLARDGKEPGWWQSYDLDPAFSPYIGLEADATSTKYYQSTVIPGLLQTADYARAMHEAARPALPEDLINQRVKVRLMRQELLKQVGGPSIMRAQLEGLIELSRSPHVTIRVIPYAAGAHQAMDSTFRILEFNGAQVSDVVYVEGLVGYIYLDRAQDVARYKDVFEALCQMALTPQESTALMATIVEAFTN